MNKGTRFVAFIPRLDHSRNTGSILHQLHRLPYTVNNFLTNFVKKRDLLHTFKSGIGLDKNLPGLLLFKNHSSPLSKWIWASWRDFRIFGIHSSSSFYIAGRLVNLWFISETSKLCKKTIIKRKKRTNKLLEVYEGKCQGLLFPRCWFWICRAKATNHLCRHFRLPWQHLPNPGQPPKALEG